MTIKDIKTAISDYAAAAAHARQAGFDGVEVAANGTYLIAQFLNRRLNRRADEFGAPGHRLVHEIVGAVAAAWDGQRTGVRLSPYWGSADRSPAARRNQTGASCCYLGRRTSRGQRLPVQRRRGDPGRL